jgi:hypothetical protein
LFQSHVFYGSPYATVHVPGCILYRLLCRPNQVAISRSIHRQRRSKSPLCPRALLRPAPRPICPLRPVHCLLPWLTLLPREVHVAPAHRDGRQNRILFKGVGHILWQRPLASCPLAGKDLQRETLIQHILPSDPQRTIRAISQHRAAAISIRDGHCDPHFAISRTAQENGRPVYGLLAPDNR